MIIRCADLEEQAAAEMAWALACRESLTHTNIGQTCESVLICESGMDGAAENYRMQSFIREWAAFGYVPAQKLLAKAVAQRINP